MPYITQEEREKFDQDLQFLSYHIENPGQLNYCITVLIHKYIKRFGKNYRNLNECIGVLESAKLEFYRKIAANYEDIKCFENDDVGIL